MQGAKILVTGPTGQVADPVSRAFAKDNEVWGIARFGDSEKRKSLESDGITCVPLDLEAGDFSSLPDDFDYVLNLAVVKTPNFAHDLRCNGESTGLLMSHCRKAKAFLHCSTTGVYQPKGHDLITEEDELGDNHRAMLPTYSICKIAAETLVRFAARQWNLPTTIARLSVPYGNNGGWPWIHLALMRAGHPIPLHTEQPNVFNPIHEDDYIAQIPRLLEQATVPAATVNWGGPQVSLEAWCGTLGELTGLEPRFRETENTIGSVTLDLARMQKCIGETRVPLREGLRRMLEARNPELLIPSSR